MGDEATIVLEYPSRRSSNVVLSAQGIVGIVVSGRTLWRFMASEREAKTLSVPQAVSSEGEQQPLKN